MGYRTARISELMTHEFGQVECDFEQLSVLSLSSVLPDTTRLHSFIESLQKGELVLLTDMPSKPALIKNSVSSQWYLSSDGQNSLSSHAQSSLLSRTSMSGCASTARSYSGAYSPYKEEDVPYYPEPPRPDYSNAPLPLKYEYCFDIACSHESFRRTVGCHFVLAKTKDEERRGHWDHTATENGTRYTVRTSIDEPKRLLALVASSSLGISIPYEVKVQPIGTSVVSEAFIPVTPSVQLGERLGFPTEGYYYHFYNGRLIQEYKLLGDTKWAFYGTCSTHERLDDRQGYNMLQNAILVFWKLNGKIVENQHLVYLDRQVTRDELNNLTEAWLNEHGIELDVSELIEAVKQPVIERNELPKPQKHQEPVSHIVQIDSKTSEQETWTSIASQYGLTPRELLLLNPKYDKDPMSLGIGHSLCIKKTEPFVESEPVYLMPPMCPQKVNQPLNTFYSYSDRCLADTSVKSISSDSLITKDIPVINLKKLSDEATEFELGFTQVEQTQSLDEYWQTLFSSETSEETQALLRKYNAHLNNPVRQGEIVVLPTKEPTTQHNKDRLDALIEEAKAVSVELAKLTEEQVATVNRHFELLDYYASEELKQTEESDLYGYASMGVGAISAGVGQHLKNINGVLLEINHLYVAQVAIASRTGGVNYGSFVAERAELFKKLDGSFAALSKRSVQLPVYTQIKRNLKLSTRSVIHHADEIIAEGFVPNLGKRMANVAIGIGASRSVGHVGLVLGGASSAKTIYDACSINDTGECGKVTTREFSGFLGGLGGGAIGGKVAVSGTILVLGVAGVTSAPILAIASVGAAVIGGSMGGITGTTTGKIFGDILYEKVIDLKKSGEELVEDWL